MSANRTNDDRDERSGVEPRNYNPICMAEYTYREPHPADEIVVWDRWDGEVSGPMQGWTVFSDPLAPVGDSAARIQVKSADLKNLEEWA